MKKDKFLDPKIVEDYKHECEMESLMIPEGAPNCDFRGSVLWDARPPAARPKHWRYDADWWL